uniref:Uncharacterized protein n=1 Tax=Felis catus TaxID=9685 RepID=A0ABI7WJH1_FELCA
MTHSVVTVHPLFPATPVITQWAYEQSGPDSRDGGYAWAQQHGSFTKASLATATDECLTCQQQKPLSPQYGTIPKLIMLNSFHHGRDNKHFGLMEINAYSGYGLPFPACNASAKTTICGLAGCLIYHLVFYTASLLGKELVSQQMK